MHTLALPIQNAVRHTVMHVVQIKLFTAYLSAKNFLEITYMAE